MNLPANDVDQFLQVFFAPPNQLLWQEIKSSGTHSRLLRWVDRLREQPRRATVLPFVYKDENERLWHLNYAIAFSETQFRQLGSDLEAFIGPTFSDFQLHRAHLKPERAVQRAVLEFSLGFAYRFFSPSDPAGDRDFRDALEFMDLVTSKERPRRSDRQRSTGRMLRDFHTALETGQRAVAEAQIQELQRRKTLDALNLKFLQIQLLSRLGNASEVLALSGLPDVLRARRPLPVTQALVEAVYASYIQPLENEGNATRAVEVFRDVVLPTFGTLYATQGGLAAPEVAKSAMLLALASEPPRQDLMDRILRQGLVDPADHQWLQKISTLWKTVPEPLEAPSDPLQAADRALAAEDYDGAFSFLRGCPLSADSVQKLIAVAVELQTLESYEVARSAFSQLDANEKRILQSTRARRIILQEVLQAGTSVTQVSEPLPQNWLQWALLLKREPERKGWYKVGEKGSTEWTVSETLEQPEELAALTRVLLELQTNSEVHMVVPHLVFSLRSRERRASPELTSLFSALMMILAINKDCSVVDLRLWAELADNVLQAGPSASDYRDLVEQAILLWQTYGAPGTIDWVLDVLDSFVVHPCRDAKARSDFISALAGGLSAFPQRLSVGQIRLLRQLCSECGEEIASNLTVNRPEESAEITTIYSQLRNKTLAVYNLTEHASRRFKSVVESWFAGARVVLSHDKVGNPALQKMAENADIFLIVPSSAKHAATTFIEDHRPKSKPTLFALGRGTTGMLNALLEHVREVNRT